MKLCEQQCDICWLNHVNNVESCWIQQDPISRGCCWVYDLVDVELDKSPWESRRQGERLRRAAAKQD